MIIVVRCVMQACAVLILVSLVFALQALMPGVPLWKAVLDFTGLCLSFMFAGTLTISSLLIGSVPKRSKLGASLANRVNQQTAEGRQNHGKPAE